MKALLDGRLVVVTGDITRVQADAIVNAANSSLLGGGGVDGAIHHAGGPAILEECRKLRAERLRDGLPAGDAVETTAGRLPARYVIHTVGPVWHGGSHGEPQKLASCYRSSLELAARLGLSSIAFPAISTGIYGYPRAAAANVALEAITEFIRSNPEPRTITLVFYSADDERAFLSATGP
ncbi:MAG TPA: O-acetyl-ADP-ribose deacetylase [Spirochaetia bacterium]|nr:O-acetyl-ADP-ribose deacetylase [Spirochaetia bacterium]